MLDSFISSLSMCIAITIPFEILTYLFCVLIFKKEKQKYRRVFQNLGIYNALKIGSLFIYSYILEYIPNLENGMAETLIDIGMLINPFNIFIWFVILGLFIKNHKKDRNIFIDGSIKEKIILIFAIIIFSVSFLPWAFVSMGI